LKSGFPTQTGFFGSILFEKIRRKVRSIYLILFNVIAMNFFRLSISAGIFIGLFFFSQASGQHKPFSPYVYLGGNVSFMRNDILEYEAPLYSFHVGWGFRIHPFKNSAKWAIQLDEMFIQKGYGQIYPSRDYTFRFNYLSFQPLLSYSPVNGVSLFGGGDISILVGSNVKKVHWTYPVMDYGLTAGFSLFNTRRVGVYSKLIYNLRPLVNYSTMDELGNFTGTVHDLKNTSILLSVKYNIYNEMRR